MTEPSASRDLYERLMAIGREAFDAELFSAAYHALAAAMHCARTLPEDEALETVSREAFRQLKHIDAHAPAYEHSTQAARDRGHESIFSMLGRQAQTMVDIRRNERRREETQRPG